ncbi:hypothetical protein ACU8YC_27780, partial [Citrobacter sp. VF227]
TQSAGVALAVFASLGLGLALPFLLLTLWPPALRALPRPGAWMETLKQVLAFPVYATVAWLIWVLAQQVDPRGQLAALIGLVLAGIVHIAAVLAIPALSDTDAVSRARTSENLDHPQSIYAVATGDDPSPPEAWLPIPDPAVAVGVCA